jgi:uncharacterized protein
MKQTDTQSKNMILMTSYLDWSDKGKSSLWRYAVAALIIFIFWFILSGMAILPLTILIPNYADTLIGSVSAKLFQFIIAFLTVPFFVWAILRRPWWSVAMPKLSFRAWDFWMAFFVGVIVAGFTAIFFNLIGVMPLEMNPDFTLKTLLIIGLIGFVGIFIQAGSEELLFRGFFTQFVRRITANKYLFIGIPSLLFAAPHIANITAFGGGAIVMLPYLISGVLYGWAAYRSGSLWMSIGLHLANNYTGLIMAGTKGDQLPSAAPFLINVPDLTVGTLVVLTQSILMFLALSYLMKRRQLKQ